VMVLVGQFCLNCQHKIVLMQKRHQGDILVCFSSEKNVLLKTMNWQWYHQHIKTY
jgi:hypothetical protein